MKNKTKVKVDINQGAVKMSESIENNNKLRKFLYFVITMAVLASVLVPIAIGVGMWIAKQ